MANEEFLESLPGVYEAQLKIANISEILKKDQKEEFLSEEEREKLRKEYAAFLILLNYNCYNELPI